MRILAFVLLTAAAHAGVDDFNGRWNLRVPEDPRGRAWWLEVTGAGTPRIAGRFVGAPGGQVDEIPVIRIEGNELVWEFERQQSKLVYRARIENGKLIGHRQLGDARMEFTGKRAPAIKDKDDGAWKPGRPVELVGADMSGWTSNVRGRGVEWDVRNAIMRNRERAADIGSKAKFWNFKLHAEFRVGRGSNSGIGLRGRYEVQIYEDHGKPPAKGGNGALYSRIVPAVNASKPAGEWQTFDITLIGRTLTVVLNGTTLIDRGEVEGPTAMSTDPDEELPGPITLQGDHGLVEFRKLTVTPLSR
jgi:hypothetical protein